MDIFCYILIQLTRSRFVKDVSFKLLPWSKILRYVFRMKILTVGNQTKIYIYILYLSYLHFMKKYLNNAILYIGINLLGTLSTQPLGLCFSNINIMLQDPSIRVFDINVRRDSCHFLNFRPNSSLSSSPTAVPSRNNVRSPRGSVARRHVA